MSDPAGKIHLARVVFWMTGALAVIQFPLSLIGSDLHAYVSLGFGQFCPQSTPGWPGSPQLVPRAADASVVVPLDFMRIPLIAVIGWAFYGERLDIFILIGALIIVAGVVWNLRSESASACKVVADLPTPQLPG